MELWVASYSAQLAASLRAFKDAGKVDSILANRAAPACAQLASQTVSCFTTELPLPVHSLEASLSSLAKMSHLALLDHILATTVHHRRALQGDDCNHCAPSQGSSWGCLHVHGLQAPPAVNFSIQHAFSDPFLSIHSYLFSMLFCTLTALFNAGMIRHGALAQSCCPCMWAIWRCPLQQAPPSRYFSHTRRFHQWIIHQRAPYALTAFSNAARSPGEAEASKEASTCTFSKAVHKGSQCHSKRLPGLEEHHMRSWDDKKHG
eukprot:1142394-Pelagomonas_calceolata.AAC.1